MAIDGNEPVIPVPASAANERRTDRRLLEFLVCPVTKSPLTYDPVQQELISKRAGLAYPIRDGVPLLTTDSARSLG